MCVPILLSLLKILSELKQRRREKQAKKDWKQKEYETVNFIFGCKGEGEEGVCPVCLLIVSF